MYNETLMVIIHAHIFTDFLYHGKYMQRNMFLYEKGHTIRLCWYSKIACSWDSQVENIEKCACSMVGFIAYISSITYEKIPFVCSLEMTLEGF